MTDCTAKIITNEEIERFLEIMKGAPVVTNAQLVHFFNIPVPEANLALNTIMNNYGYKDADTDESCFFRVIIVNENERHALEKRMYTYLDGDINYISDQTDYELKMCEKTNEKQE